MPDRRNDSEANGIWLEGPVSGTTRELHTDGVGELGDETLVLIRTSGSVALPAPFAHLGIGETLALGILDRLWLDQDALALIAFA